MIFVQKVSERGSAPVDVCLLRQAHDCVCFSWVERRKGSPGTPDRRDPGLHSTSTDLGVGHHVQGGVLTSVVGIRRDPNISDSSKRLPSGRMCLGLRKKVRLRAPRALSCFIRRSLDRRFWNHTWDREQGAREP